MNMLLAPTLRHRKSFALLLTSFALFKVPLVYVHISKRERLSLTVV